MTSVSGRVENESMVQGKEEKIRGHMTRSAGSSMVPRPAVSLQNLAVFQGRGIACGVYARRLLFEHHVDAHHRSQDQLS
jgi:hypothetical protein